MWLWSVAAMKNKRAAKAPGCFHHPGDLERGVASSWSPIASFFCKKILKWNIKACCSAFVSKPKEFHMVV